MSPSLSELINASASAPSPTLTRKALLSAIATSPLADRVDPDTVVTAMPFTPHAGEGKSYRIIVTSEMDEYDPLLPPTAMFAAGPLAAKKPSDTFQGTARRAAKLSIPNAIVENFADLQDLLASLPSKNKMVNHNPVIKTDKNSGRVVEEKRNVLLRVWLYAASRESDNDFHLILGRAPGLTPEVFMTMELSGLPRSDSAAYPALKATRDAFKTFFGTNIPGATYSFFDPPIPVEIQGAPFFDMTHATGSKPGPQKLRDRMPTIWEVHPITHMVFEP
jgi:hypothetical protein